MLAKVFAALNIALSFDHEAKHDDDPLHQMIAKDLAPPYQYS